MAHSTVYPLMFESFWGSFDHWLMVAFSSLLSCLRFLSAIRRTGNRVNHSVKSNWRHDSCLPLSVSLIKRILFRFVHSTVVKDMHHVTVFLGFDSFLGFVWSMANGHFFIPFLMPSSLLFIERMEYIVIVRSKAIGGMTSVPALSLSNIERNFFGIFWLAAVKDLAQATVSPVVYPFWSLVVDPLFILFHASVSSVSLKE